MVGSGVVGSIVVVVVVVVVSGHDAPTHTMPQLFKFVNGVMLLPPQSTVHLQSEIASVVSIAIVVSTNCPGSSVEDSQPEQTKLQFLFPSGSFSQTNSQLIKELKNF